MSLASQFAFDSACRLSHVVSPEARLPMTDPASADSAEIYATSVATLLSTPNGRRRHVLPTSKLFFYTMDNSLQDGPTCSRLSSGAENSSENAKICSGTISFCADYTSLYFSASSCGERIT